MKYACFGFLTVMAINRVENTVVVANQCRNIVPLKIAGGIPSMVPEVVDDEVEVVDQERPKRVIEIDRQPVAVTQDESWAFRIPVTPQNDDGVIVDPGFTSGERFGYLPYGF